MSSGWLWTLFVLFAGWASLYVAAQQSDAAIKAVLQFAAVVNIINAAFNAKGINGPKD